MSDFLTCPACGKLGCAVKDSRPTENGAFVKRRRRCSKCEHRYTTIEIPADEYNRLLSVNKLAARLRKVCRDTITNLDRGRYEHLDTDTGASPATVEAGGRSGATIGQSDSAEAKHDVRHDA